ncbi:hypothetical protein [Gimesia aquarii]|uniref:Cytochrome C n=1 Tax=Gimesia aquarii TaxID=2527964 RepID=A0A517W0T2_9PLAN|nr:hypothetical protein [Gimesia aquarii]QDT98863.1 hypothetical protein V144x_43720 [Gimesia aquarii]
MKKNMPYILVIAVTCLSAFALSSYADNEKPKNKAQKNSAVSKKDKSEKEKDFWMQAKLKKSQRILAALTEGDFKSVEKNARALQGFGILESWLRDSPETSKSEYKAQLNKFEFANKELIRMAEDKNADGSATAFAALTITCVKCHNLIRDTDEK